MNLKINTSLMDTEINCMYCNRLLKSNFTSFANLNFFHCQHCDIEFSKKDDQLFYLFMYYHDFLVKYSFQHNKFMLFRDDDADNPIFIINMLSNEISPEKIKNIVNRIKNLTVFS